MNFGGSKLINEIDVFGLQQNPSSPVEPTPAMTSSYALTNFEVQYWTGSGWATVPGGSVTGNDKVWRKFTFAALTTSKIKVHVTNVAGDNRSQVVEIEAYAVPNAALAGNGATVSASSVVGAQVPAHAINGDRKGLNSGWWADNTSNGYPDWIEVDFGGSKTINEIDVFGLQQNPSSPVEPTPAMTSSYALTNFEVQYWTDSAWATVPGGSVTGNDKVWRKFTFAALTTSKIRVHVTAVAGDNRSQVVEIEAHHRNVHWLVADQLGTPRMIFDQTGSFGATKRHDYLPFGEELYAGQGGRTTALGYTGDTIRQQFTSKERDIETGLDYFLARYYSSTQGRFSSPDVPFMDQWVFDPKSWNLYTYVRNNPLRLIDPTGHSAQQKCDEICQESKRKAEEARKQAEAEGVDVIVIDTPAVIEVTLVSEPPPPPTAWEKAQAGEFELGIPVAGGLRSPQGMGGGSRLSSFFRKLFGRQKRTVREIAEELGYSPSNAVKEALKGRVARETIPPKEREIAAKFYERVANEVVSGPKEAAAKALNLARAKFLKEGGKPPIDIHGFDP